MITEQELRLVTGCPEDFEPLEWLEELKSRAGGSLEQGIDRLNRLEAHADGARDRIEVFVDNYGAPKTELFQ